MQAYVVDYSERNLKNIKFSLIYITSIWSHSYYRNDLIDVDNLVLWEILLYGHVDMAGSYFVQIEVSAIEEKSLFLKKINLVTFNESNF